MMSLLSMLLAKEVWIWAELIWIGTSPTCWRLLSVLRNLIKVLRLIRTWIREIGARPFEMFIILEVSRFFYYIRLMNAPSFYRRGFGGIFFMIVYIKKVRCLCTTCTVVVEGMNEFDEGVVRLEFFVTKTFGFRNNSAWILEIAVRISLGHSHLLVDHLDSKSVRWPLRAI